MQQFRPMKTLDPDFGKEKAYSKAELERFKKLLEPYFDSVEVRA